MQQAKVASSMSTIGVAVCKKAISVPQLGATITSNCRPAKSFPAALAKRLAMKKL